MGANGPLKAVAMHFLDILGQLQSKPATGAAGDDGACEDVRGYLVQGGGEPQHLVCIHQVASRDDVGQDRVSLGQGAGLVKQHDLPGRQSFEGAAALDDDADVRGAAPVSYTHLTLPT